MSIEDLIISNRIREPLKILLYGDNGVGKSTFGRQMPAPLFLDIEGNISHMDAPRIPIQRWSDTLSVLDYLLETPHSYKTVVVDSIDQLEQLIWEQICSENAVNSIEALPYGRGYRLAQSIWKTFLDKMDVIRSHGMSTLFIGHPASVHGQTVQGQDFEQIGLRINKKAAELIQDRCHCILYASFDMFIKSEQGTFGRCINRAFENGDRVLYTNGYGAFLAKNVYGLPDSLPLSWAELDRLISAYFQNDKK